MTKRHGFPDVWESKKSTDNLPFGAQHFASRCVRLFF